MKNLPLAELETLDRSALHLFVCGPGYGEVVLVALPKGGWLVVDGAKVSGEVPAIKLLDRYARSDGDPIEALLLTHAHQDHAGGFVDLLDDPRWSAEVKKISCVAKLVEARKKSTAELEVEAMRDAAEPDGSTDATREGTVLSALERIRTEWERRPSRKQLAFADTEIPVESPDVRVMLRSPTALEVESFFASSGLANRLKSRANDLSVVVELTWHDLRLVLGGDLPETCNKVPVASGWRAVLERSPKLAEHAGLKLPHHGSGEAQPEGLLGRRGREAGRTWTITPYNRQRGLPSFERGGGAERLVARCSRIGLTALPRGWPAQTPLPDVTAISSLVPKRNRIGGWPGIAVSSDDAISPVECTWVFRFERDGTCTAAYRGQGATALSDG